MVQFLGSTIPLDHLKKDAEILSELPPEKFEKAVARASRSWKKRNRAIESGKSKESSARLSEAEKATKDFELSRIYPQTTNVFPVFTVAGSGKMPLCHLEKERGDIDHTFENITLSEVGKAPAKYQPTKDDLDEFVKDLADRIDIFPWKHKRNGCNARAMLMIRFLILMGVPKNQICKVFFIVPKEKAISQSEDWTWQYHVAPALKLSDGSIIVLDPSLDAEKSVDLVDWLGKQTPIKGKAQLFGKINEPETLLLKPEFPACICTSYNMYPRDMRSSPDEDGSAAIAFQLEKEDDSIVISEVNSLGINRATLDVLHLKDSFPLRTQK